MQTDLPFCPRCETLHPLGKHVKSVALKDTAQQKPQEAPTEAISIIPVQTDRKEQKRLVMAPYMRDRRAADREGYGGSPENNPKYLTVKQWRLMKSAQTVAA